MARLRGPLLNLALLSWVASLLLGVAVGRRPGRQLIGLGLYAATTLPLVVVVGDRAVGNGWSRAAPPTPSRNGSRSCRGLAERARHER